MVLDSDGKQTSESIDKDALIRQDAYDDVVRAWAERTGRPVRQAD